MHPNLNTAYQATTVAGSSNRVLRNTYALLATSLIPTMTVGAVILMIAVVANIFMRLPALQLTIAAAFAFFSSLMILWEVKNVVDGGETSYISAALSIFISIYNLFSSLLQLLIALSGDRR